MPQLGESIAEATIVDIKVKPGDEVAADQEIIDVETNKAVMGVTTPCKGKIDKITAQLKETYPIGSVLGYVEASEADAARFTRQAPPQAQTEVAEEIPAPAIASRSKISRIFCTRSTTKAQRKLRRFAPAWRTRCGAVGRGRSRPSVRR